MRAISSYLDYSKREDVLSGGATRIPVNTAAGTYRIWVKRVGNNPALRLLLLHGGPGSTHEYLEACDSYLPAAGVEYYYYYYYYYDQLGSGHSDQPDEPSLWELDRFVDEVEQVRQALGLDRDSFVLYGQSWGGILAIEYALTYQHHLRGLAISNMMASVPAYNAYAEQVLMPEMDQVTLAEIKSLEEAGQTEDARYMELLNEHPGTGPQSLRRSRCPPWSSAPATTPWTRLLARHRRSPEPHMKNAPELGAPLRKRTVDLLLTMDHQHVPVTLTAAPNWPDAGSRKLIAAVTSAR